MNSKFSTKEQQVIEYFHDIKVRTIYDVIQKLEISKRTIIRSLNKCGYYSSYNYNARYYTLQDIPTFNDYGLWNYNDIRFSKYKSITETILVIINKSEAGYTNTEMSHLLGTETKNLLSRLRKQDRLTKFYIGHQAVYLSTDPDRNEAQKESRNNQRLLQLEHSQKGHREGGNLPEGIDVMTIISVLTSMIRKPTVGIASLSKSLQAKDVKLTAEDIHKIISFYGLEKKTVR